MVSLDTIREAMRDHRAEVIEDPGAPRAAVAMVFREGPGATELLFIERAQREGDPWSGHMAFPGGRVEPVDPGTRAAALRETHEEVGLSLYQSEPLGRLDDQRGYRGGQQLSLVISPFLYHLEEEQQLRITHEVAVEPPHHDREQAEDAWWTFWSERSTDLAGYLSELREIRERRLAARRPQQPLAAQPLRASPKEQGYASGR